MNNGWDLGVQWAKSFYGGVLKCGPRPFALAEATSRCSALTSSCDKGCDDAASVFSGARRGHITHNLVYRHQTDI